MERCGVDNAEMEKMALARLRQLSAHEVGHTFGSPDLYPKTGAIHKVGGYAVMGDIRGATGFMG